jgi:hypothetical protein
MRVPLTARFVALALVVGGCGHSTLPSPQTTIDAYVRATKRGDHKALHALLAERDRIRLSVNDVSMIARENSAELRTEATKFDGRGVITEATAEIAFEDGERVTLDLERGQFQIGSVGTLPGGSASPNQAIAELRRALARRSYPALLRVLSPKARRIMEDMLRSLVTGLAHPEPLPIVENGDTAKVRVPGGHLVKLRREGNEWHVDSFE